MILLEHDDYGQLSIKQIDDCLVVNQDFDIFDDNAVRRPVIQECYWSDGRYAIPGVIVYFDETDDDHNFVFSFFGSQNFRLDNIEAIKSDTRTYIVRTDVAVESVKGLKRGELMACGIIGYWLSDMTKGETQLFEDYYNICLQKYRDSHSNGKANPQIDGEFICKHHIQSEKEKIRLSNLEYRIDDVEWDRIVEMTERYLKFAEDKKAAYENDVEEMAEEEQKDVVSSEQMKKAVNECLDCFKVKDAYNAATWAVVWVIWKNHGFNKSQKEFCKIVESWGFKNRAPEVNADTLSRLKELKQKNYSLYGNPADWKGKGVREHLCNFGLRLEKALSEQTK